MVRPVILALPLARSGAKPARQGESDLLLNMGVPTDIVYLWSLLLLSINAFLECQRKLPGQARLTLVLD
jgi:hypothetical protein